MSTIDDIIAKHDIGEMLARVCRAADERDPAGFAAGFLDDGSWVRGAGIRLVGRDAIASFMAAIPADRVMRHVTGGSVVTLHDADHASAHTQVVLYTGSTEQGAPPPLTGPEKVFDYDDELVRTEEGWRIGSRVTTLVFAR